MIDMSLLSFLLIFASILSPSKAGGTVHLDQVIKHVADVSNYNLKIISENFNNSFYSSLDMPAELLTDFTSLPKPFCSSFDVTLSEVKRDRKPDLYLIESKSSLFLARVLEAFNATITRCISEMRPGVYWSENVFLFLAQGIDGKVMEQQLLSDKNIRMHKHVAILEMRNPKTIHAKAFNIYNGRAQYTTSISLQGDPKTFKSDIFPEFDMNGYVFRVTSLPYSYWTSAEFNANFTDPRQMFKHHTGSEIIALQSICQKLNCKTKFFNTVKMVWGGVWEGGTSGVFTELMDDQTDIVTGNLLGNRRFKVATFTYGLSTSNWFGIVGPKPKPTRSTFDLLRPFGLYLWICLSASIVIIPFSFVVLRRLDFLVSNQEKDQEDDYEGFWTSLIQAFWYTFGTLMGENVTTTGSNEHSVTLKFVAVAWFMFGFLLTASYGGNLRAILLSPRMNEPITTPRGVVESGLSWSMPTYGDEMDRWLAENKDPILRKIWEGNKPLDSMDEYQYDKLREVYDGKALYIEYNTLVDIGIKAGFTRSNGEAELYRSVNVFWNGVDRKYNFVWFFQAMNPWIRRFDKYLYYAFDSGLSNEWIKRASNDLVLKYKKVSPPLPVEEQVDIKMRMEENSGIFFLFLVLVGINVVFMALEKSWANMDPEKKKKFVRRMSVKLYKPNFLT